MGSPYRIVVLASGDPMGSPCRIVVLASGDPMGSPYFTAPIVKPRTK